MNRLFLLLIICVSIITFSSCVTQTEVVDHFPYSYYSNEECGIVDTIESHVDSVYTIEVSFFRLYRRFSYYGHDSCSNKLFYMGCGQSLSESLELGIDSSFVIKTESVDDLFGIYVIRNAISNICVDVIIIRPNKKIKFKKATLLQKEIYPHLLEYTLAYERYSKNITTVISNNISYKSFVISPTRTIKIIPKNNKPNQ